MLFLKRAKAESGFTSLQKHIYYFIKKGFLTQCVYMQLRRAMLTIHRWRCDIYYLLILQNTGSISYFVYTAGLQLFFLAQGIPQINLNLKVYHIYIDAKHAIADIMMY